MLLKLAAAALAATVALPANAADCVQNRAVYTEKDNGYVLSFRPTEPWEGAANMMTVMDLAFPDGKHIWGVIFIPNGTAPVIRYSGLVMSPGDEPHEIFTLKGCTD